MKSKLEKQKGITLVALVITIIVLLILAMVSIKIAIDGGLTTKASDATKQHIIASEEEAIQTGYAAYQIELAQKGTADLKVKGAKKVTPKGEDWNVTFTKTNNEYELKKDGTVKLIKEGNDSTTDSTESAYITPRIEVTYKGKTLKVGDYVNYDEGTGYTWTTDASKGTGGDYNLNSKTYTTENMDWRVLGLDKNGNLELIGDKQTTQYLYLKGKAGYFNGEEQLNEMCNSLYGKGTKAQSARSVNVEDIDAVLGYNKKGFKKEAIAEDNNTWMKFTYGCKVTYTSTKHSGDWFKLNGENVISRKGKYANFNDIDGKQATDENPITLESNYYEYSNSEFEYKIDSKTIEMVFDLENIGCNGEKSRFWLASKCININMEYTNPFNAVWSLFDISNGKLGDTWLNISGDGEDGNGNYIRPVVTLKADVELSGNSNDGWTIN